MKDLEEEGKSLRDQNPSTKKYWKACDFDYITNWIRYNDYNSDDDFAKLAQDQDQLIFHCVYQLHNFF